MLELIFQTTKLLKLYIESTLVLWQDEGKGGVEVSMFFFGGIHLYVVVLRIG